MAGAVLAPTWIGRPHKSRQNCICGWSFEMATDSGIGPRDGPAEPYEEEKFGYGRFSAVRDWGEVMEQFRNKESLVQCGCGWTGKKKPQLRGSWVRKWSWSRQGWIGISHQASQVRCRQGNQTGSHVHRAIHSWCLRASFIRRCTRWLKCCVMRSMICSRDNANESISRHFRCHLRWTSTRRVFDDCFAMRNICAKRDESI